MKELFGKSAKDRTSISIQREVKKKQELQLKKQIKPHFGHTLWEIDKNTLEVKKAVYNLNTTYRLNWRWKKGDKLASYGALIVNPLCEYVSALNEKSALKKYLKGLDGSKFDVNKDYLCLKR